MLCCGLPSSLPAHPSLPPLCIEGNDQGSCVRGSLYLNWSYWRVSAWCSDGTPSSRGRSVCCGYRRSGSRSWLRRSGRSHCSHLGRLRRGTAKGEAVGLTPAPALDDCFRGEPWPAPPEWPCRSPPPPSPLASAEQQSRRRETAGSRRVDGTRFPHERPWDIGPDWHHNRSHLRFDTGSHCKLRSCRSRSPFASRRFPIFISETDRVLTPS